MRIFNSIKSFFTKPLGRKSEKIEGGKFSIVEGYKNARASLMFSLSTSKNYCFAVTSWSKGEGKSTAAANLAISFSKTEKRVLLIDSDLRRPSIHNLLKLDNEYGLSHVLCGDKEFEEVVCSSVYPNLDVLTSGAIPPNPSELLCSKHYEEMAKMAKTEYDYVIFDTPPIGIVSDALLLKNEINGYVLVVKERSTKHGEIRKALEKFTQIEAKLLGFLKVGCKKKYRRNSKQSPNYYSSYY